jgi:hypothetical protein
MTAPIARIILRYVVGILVARAIFTNEDGNALISDPEIAQMVELGVGVAIGAVTEGWYALARRWGWSK